MKNLYTTIFFCFAIGCVHAQKVSFESMFSKPEKSYELGKYKKALRQSKSISEGNKNTVAQAWGAIHLAQIHEAMGLYEEMNKDLQQAELKIAELRQSNLEEYLVGLIKIAEVHNNYGNSLKSLQILENEEYVRLVEQTNKAIQNDWTQQIVKAYLLAGNFGDAESKLISLLDARKNQLEKDKSAASKKDIKKQYAKALTLRGALETQRGDYTKADSILKAYQIQVRKLTGVTKPTYIEHLIALAENAEEQGEYTKANRYYAMSKRATEYYSNTFRQSSKTYFRLQEGIARNVIENNGILQVLRVFELNRDAKRYFDKSSIYPIKARMVKIEQMMSRRRYPEARKELLDILSKENVVPKDHEIRARAMKYLGQIYTKIDVSSSEMEKVYQDWFTIQKSRYKENSFYYQASEVEMANYYNEETEDYRKAKTAFEKNPFEIIEKSLNPAHPDYVRFSNYYARYYEMNDNYGKALTITKKSADLVEKKYGFNNIRLADQLRRLADIEVKNGDYRSAEGNISKAIGILKNKYGEEAERSPLFAEALGKMASIHGVIANYTLADSLLRKSETIYKNYETEQADTKKKKKKKKRDDDEDEVPFDVEAMKMESIEELARQYVRIGDYTTTEQLLKETITEREKKYGVDSRRLIKPLIELSNLYLIKGEYVQTENNIIRATNLSEKVYGRESLIFAESQEIMARLHTNLGDFDKAKREISECIKIVSKNLNQEHIRNAPFITDLAIIELAENPQKNAEKVEKDFNQAKKIIEKTFGNKHPQYAESLQNLALVYIETKKLQEALSFLNQAESIWQSKLGGQNIHIAKISNLKGDAYIKSSNLQEAEKNYEKAKTLYAQIFGERYEGYIKTISKLGRVYYIQKNYEKANQALTQSTDAYLSFIQKNFPAMSEREKAKYWVSIQSDFEFFKTLASQQIKTKPELLGQAYNHILVTKGLLLSSSMKVRQRILNSKDQNLINTYNNWIKKKEYLAQVLALTAEERKLAKIDFVKLEQEIEVLEKQMSSASEVLAGVIEQKNPSWKDVQSKLKDNEVALEIVRFRYFDKSFTDSTMYMVLKIGKNSMNPEAVLLANGNEMDRDMLNYYRNTIRFSKSNNSTYKTYWKPMENLAQGASKVYISPDGVYTQINLETLQSTEGFLIDKYNFVFISNTKDLLINNTVSNTSKTVMVVADPSFYLKTNGSKIVSLPGTAIEANNIKSKILAKNWKIVEYRKNEAEEERIKQNNIQPNVLHFATHGYFVEDVNTVADASKELAEIQALQSPMLRSGILLAGAGDALEDNSSINTRNGILTAYEMANMPYDNVDIAILSACETGLGDVQVGEGVFGLQRSLLVGGAKSIIMSLFKVDDSVTAELMSEFYEHYLENPQEPREAFRKAKMTIKAKYPKPLLWGAFVMIGIK
ncbi:MAG: CHAT domain-containing protein [Raineya sp.]|jgi:CHAT domain-containing protein|nr:CHAT domain-containing protein [Raineya sp.]